VNYKDKEMKDEIIKKDDIKWSGSRIQCDVCTHKWIAVFPSDLDKIECPHCLNMVNFEIIE